MELKKKLRPKSSRSFDINMKEGLVSDDVLLAKYLEEFYVKKDTSKNKPKKMPDNKSLLKSPYASATQLTTVRSSISNKSSNYKSPHPPSKKKKRPVSAPVYRLGTGSWASFDDLQGSSFSAACHSTCGFSTSSRSSNKPIYKRKHYIFCVNARSNGSREKTIRVTGNDLQHLLAEATAKLGLASAGRKMYLSDGSLVVSVHQLYKDVDVYISSGEPFKDPFEDLHDNEVQTKSSIWTLSGIITPGNNKQKKLRSSLSARMMDLVESQKYRVLVFKNGESQEGVEVVANRFDEFLDDCTDKLHLSSHAKCLYDWVGQEVVNFSQVPVLHKVLQPNTGIVMGPLWATKGEAFMPKGAYKFLKTMVNNTKEQIQNQVEYIQELETHLDIDGVIISNPPVEQQIELESFTLEELQEAYTDLLNHFKKIKEAYSDQEAMTESQYKWKNIQEIDANSRLLTTTGVKVKLFANGSKTLELPLKIFINLSQFTKGVKTKEQAMDRFFEYLNSRENVKELFGLQRSNIVIKRAFLPDGTEITNINLIVPDAEIWLSLGENFVPIDCHIIMLNMEKVKVMNLWGLKQIVQRDVWVGFDQNQAKPRLWTTTSFIPSECENHEMKIEMDDSQKSIYLKQSNETRLKENSTFLQSKQDQSLVLFPEPVLHTKSLLQLETDSWGEKIKMWTISNNGQITNKHFKNIVLGICDEPIEMLFVDNGEEEILDGALVHCQTKSESHDNSSLWEFTAGGYIQPINNPGYVLTAVSGFTVSPIKDSSMNNNDDDDDDDEYKDDFEDDEKNAVQSNPFENIEDIHGGQKMSLVILPKFPSKHELAKTQRWAIKTTNTYDEDNNSLCTTWVQQKLSWPTDERGNYTQPFLEGYLCFNAPKLKWKKLQNAKDEVFKVALTEQPIRLQVLVNGDKEIDNAISVVAPNTKHMKKDVTTQFGKNGQMKRLSPDELEFLQFLQKCTDALGLPFAARRLFDTNGKEHFTLTQFEKNDTVYISCGEGWNDPSVSQAEQQKRLLLANLVSDVAKMKHYIALKKQAGFVIRAGSRLESGSKLYLCHKTDAEDKNAMFRKSSLDSQAKTKEEELVLEEANEPTEPMTAHQRSHAKFEVQHAEVDVNEDLSDERPSVTHREALFGSDRSLDRPPRPSPFHWVYDDEFICLKSNNNLVLGVDEKEGSSHNEVMLARKKVEQSNQRWIVANDGTICLKTNPQLVLSISPPPIKPAEFVEFEENDSIYLYSRLIVAPRKFLMNGNANQMFWLDKETSLLHCFTTDDVNKEVTAANKSLVCTYAVFGKNEISQPGYIWHAKESGLKTNVHFCESCGKSVRGKIKLESITPGHMVEFSCAMGGAVKLPVKLTGSFLCVGSQVDLSYQECHATVALWENQLQRLREENSVRAIATELMSLQNNPAVRILAHRNGERTPNEGVIVIGNSIAQLLDQCTSKLNLPKAARRMYSMDGELITDMQHLLLPYYPEITFMRDMQNQMNLAKNKDGESKPIKIEKLDVRIPVDVWISMGEPFVPLDELEKEEWLRRFEQYEKFSATKNLENEKHKLRQAKGRRMAQLNYNRSIKPVVMKAWNTPTENESSIERSIDNLKNHLKEVRLQQESRASDLKVKRRPSLNRSPSQKSKRIYQIPQAIRLLVFPNGESCERNEVIFAKSISEVLDNATYKLGLSSCARRVFTAEGKEVFDINELERNQLVCVSSGEKFVAYRDRRNKIELKATWSRMNRQLLEDSRKESFHNESRDYNNNKHVAFSTAPESRVVLSKRPKSARVGWS